MLGIVKWFDCGKGYGFISSDDDHKDYFVHYSEIRMKGYQTLFEGQKVEFEPVEDDKGPMAKDVRKVNE